MAKWHSPFLLIPRNMGRSRVKYRTSHGRGRGRAGTEEQNEVLKKRRPFHLKNVGSNAFRYEKDDDEEDDGQVADHATFDRRTQFFASEQKCRETTGSAVRGEYYESRVMKEWEEKDDAVDQDGAIGVLDMKWIVAQLELVSPDIRYRLDPKYCTDLVFQPQDKDDQISDGRVVIEKLDVTSPATENPLKPAQGDEELDFLLKLSASTCGDVKQVSTSSGSLSAPSAVTATAIDSEQLEGWLDDVLDM